MKLSKSKLNQLMKLKSSNAEFNVIEHLAKMHKDKYLLNSDRTLNTQNLSLLEEANLVAKDDIYKNFNVFSELYTEGLALRIFVSSNFFKNAIQNHLISKDQVEYVIDSCDSAYSALNALSQSEVLLSYLLEQNIFSFEKLIEFLKTKGTLAIFYEHIHLDDFLAKHNLYDVKSLKVIWDSIQTPHTFLSVCCSKTCEQTFNALKLYKLYDFKAFIDKISSDSLEHSHRRSVIVSDFFSKSLKSNVIDEKDIEYALAKILRCSDVGRVYLSHNPKFFSYVVHNDMIDVQQYVKSLKDDNTLDSLLLHEKAFYELLKEASSQNVLKFVQLLYNRIDSFRELKCLSSNTTLLSYLFDKRVVTFQDFIKRFKKYDVNPYLDHVQPSYYESLLKNKDFFKFCNAQRLLKKEDYRCLFENLDFSNKAEVLALLSNERVMKNLFKHSVLTFKKLIELLAEHSLSYTLLSNLDLMKMLLSTKYVHDEDIRLLISSSTSPKAVQQLSFNTDLLFRAVESKVCSFAEIVELFSQTQLIERLLNNKVFLKKLISHKLLTENDLVLILDNLSDFSTFKLFCSNSALVNEVMKKFVLTKKHVEDFNKFLHSLGQYSSRSSSETLTFKALKTYSDQDEYALELIQDNENIYKYDLYNFNLTVAEKLKLIELIEQDESIKNKILMIVQTKIEDSFQSFDELLSYLSKKEKRHSLNI